LRILHFFWRSCVYYIFPIILVMVFCCNFRLNSSGFNIVLFFKLLHYFILKILKKMNLVPSQIFVFEMFLVAKSRLSSVEKSVNWSLCGVGVYVQVQCNKLSHLFQVISCVAHTTTHYLSNKYNYLFCFFDTIIYFVNPSFPWNGFNSLELD
jgi:hypothetical protein